MEAKILYCDNQITKIKLKQHGRQ